MGGATSQEEAPPARPAVFTQRDILNLRQVYAFLCLHTTTLTACQLDQSQFTAIFSMKSSHTKAYWATLFQAIDTQRDGAIDFDEFLAFVAKLKRGDGEQRRRLVFQLLDSDYDGAVGLADLQRVQERPAGSRDSSLQELQQRRQNPSESQLVFNLIDDDYDGLFDFDDFDKYCREYGDAFVMQTLRPVELAFDEVIRPTGIVISTSDVRNTKPHIDWQDHKVEMYGYLCCSPAAPPVFSKTPASGYDR